MCSDRRPIRIESAIRLASSTVITTSAVSEEIVAPLPRHRDADVGEREGGRVVDPVPDHDDVARARPVADRPHDAELALGCLLGVDGVDARAPRDFVRDLRRSPVTSATWPMPAAWRSCASASAPGRRRSPITTTAARWPSTPTRIRACPASRAVSCACACMPAPAYPLPRATRPSRRQPDGRRRRRRCRDPAPR